MLILLVNNVVSWFYFLIDENYILTDISDEAIVTIDRIYHTVGHQYDPDMVSNIDRFRDQVVDLGFLSAKNYARKKFINIFWAHHQEKIGNVCKEFAGCEERC
ncbi:hypothetical protein Y032_0168g176 [Ancylostoma ceylanicum]|uniref:Uncharacterized protein n=1 Tax=Ancylostoma ceylanicum TaxID=53326 RepID=A0A016SWC9_9BILA|nr:hypothetical protein Y032_0168g176 [Ancylostoma ceylanicum]